MLDYDSASEKEPPRIVTRSTAERSMDAVGSIAFLAYSPVPQDLWRLLSPAQRDLHLLWARKLAGAYDDYERVRSADVWESERKTIQALIQAISQCRIQFSGPYSHVASAVDFSFLRARATLLGEHVVVKAAVLTLRSTEPNRRQYISLQAH